MLYHLFSGRAYRDGDLSIIYPLAQTAMFWVPIWGILLLGEKVSGLGIVGILLILFGAYSIQLKALAWNEVIRPFRNLRDPAVLAALAAACVVEPVLTSLGGGGFLHLIGLCCGIVFFGGAGREEHGGKREDGNSIH